MVALPFSAMHKGSVCKLVRMEVKVRMEVLVVSESGYGLNPDTD